MRRLALVSLSLASVLTIAACGDDIEPRRDAAVLGGSTGGENDGSARDASGGSGGHGGAAGAGAIDGSTDVATGGKGGTAGVDGGTGGTGGVVVVACPSITFIRPGDGAMLTAADDGDTNTAGFQYTVQLATSAADGAPFKLLDGTQVVASANSAGATVAFTNAQLTSQGTTKLTARWNDRTDCDKTINITVDTNVPTCTISKPAISPTHPLLNNVPAANGGDRVSSPGSDYQAAFEVTTNLTDGQTVSLAVTTGSNTTSTVTAQATGGVARFPGVTLRPDGSYSIIATCTDAAGVVGKSAQSTFTVDTAAPDLTITSPSDGKHYNPGDLVNGAFKVCGQTTAPDAINVPATLGNAGNNLSVAIGSASAAGSTAVTAVGTDACVDVACPTGSAPFDVNVVLTDTAGNPATKKISGVSCSSTLPSVAIVTPVGDSAPFADVTKRLLSAASNNAFKDLDPNTSGAQANVVACTDRANGTATLYAGPAGGTLTPLASPVVVTAAQAADGCPTSLGFVAKWASVTLPDSAEAADSTLTAATRLRVDVTDVSLTVGSSPPTDLWVDVNAPALQPLLPSDLCTLLHQSATDWSTDVRLSSAVASVVLSVTNGATTDTYATPVFMAPSFVDFGTVIFRVGDSNIAAVATEPSGNTGTLPSSCVVRVGTPPVVTFVSPANGSKLCASTTGGGCLQDGDANTAGWQGTLSATVSVAGTLVNGTGSVTFTAAPGNVALGTAPIDATGTALLTPAVTIPDGTTQITATTSQFDTGVGTASSAVTVDTVVPSPVGAITVVTKSHRQTTFTLSWSAPADGALPVAGYDVRVSTQPINDANFTAAQAVSFLGTPATVGAPESLDVPNRLIETPNYFAIVALDGAGNRSTVAYPAISPTTEHFNTTLLPAPVAASGFGAIVDGAVDIGSPTQSVTSDGASDLIVGEGAGSRAYLYYGGSSFAPTAPDVTFQGNAGSFFGVGAAFVGDVDGDGLEDIAISARGDGNGTIYIFSRKKLLGNGKSPFAKGGTVALSDAAYQIQAGSAYSGSFFGNTIAKLGDFNGDGVDDFVVTAPRFNSNTGRAVVVFGKLPTDASFPTAISLPDATHTITIDGPTAGERFGISAVGLGHFYSSGGNTLIVGSQRYNGSAGRVYAFRGQPGSSGVIATFDAVSESPAVGAQYGTVLANLGPTTGGLPSLGIGNPFDVSLTPTNGSVTLTSGTDATGPFAPTSWRVKDSASTGASDGFGGFVVGGGFSGSAATVSLIGDSHVDLAFGSVKQTGSSPNVLYVVDGTRLSGLTSPFDAASAADLKVPLPADWAGTTFGSRLAKDINGDGYGDIVLGQTPTSAQPDGRVAVIW